MDCLFDKNKQEFRLFALVYSLVVDQSCVLLKINPADGISVYTFAIEIRKLCLDCLVHSESFKFISLCCLEEVFPTRSVVNCQDHKTRFLVDGVVIELQFIGP